MDDVEGLRNALRARRDSCWERFGDVVSELIELHEIPVEELVARVAQLAQDDDAGEAPQALA